MQEKLLYLQVVLLLNQTQDTAVFTAVFNTGQSSLVKRPYNKHQSRNEILWQKLYEKNKKEVGF